MRHFTALSHKAYLLRCISLNLFSAFTVQLHLGLVPQCVRHDTGSTQPRLRMMDPNSMAIGEHNMVWIAWISPPSQTLLLFELFHSLMLLSLSVGEAHLVSFPPSHFSPNTASGMD